MLTKDRCAPQARQVGWMACFRRLAHDYERLVDILAGLHFVPLPYCWLIASVDFGAKYITDSKRSFCGLFRHRAYLCYNPGHVGHIHRT
jgi:hypothetical protein